MGHDGFVIGKDRLIGGMSNAFGDDFRPAITRNGNLLGRGPDHSALFQPSIEARFESRTVDADGVAQHSTGPTASQQRRRHRFGSDAKAFRHVANMRERIDVASALGKKDRIDAAERAAAANAAHQADGLWRDGGERAPGFGARDRSDRKIHASRQPIARLAFPNNEYALAVGAGQQTGQKLGQWRRAEDGKVEDGFFGHAANGLATTGPCGNASLSSHPVLMVFRCIRLIQSHALPRLADKRLGPMIFWSIAIAVTAIACAALFYAAAGRTVNVTGANLAAPDDHFRVLLAGIDADEQSGKLEPDQALAARGELARELLRSKSESQPGAGGTLGRAPLLVGLIAVAAISFGVYAVLGRPDLPAQPLTERREVAAQNLDIADAIAQIEARLAQTPDDVRGWEVIAPAYVEQGRFADAAKAYRQVIALSGVTPELQTKLAETLLLDAGGAGSDEAMELLRSAAAADPTNILARLYLGAELMRAERYDEAVPYWQSAIDQAQGDEAWLPAATQGLAVAQNGGVDPNADAQATMIQGMVDGLSARLFAEGGTVQEWTQLVRSYLVLNDKANAQRAFDEAVAAYPAAVDRAELDTFALGAGLTINGDSQ